MERWSWITVNSSELMVLYNFTMILCFAKLWRFCGILWDNLTTTIIFFFSPYLATENGSVDNPVTQSAGWDVLISQPMNDLIYIFCHIQMTAWQKTYLQQWGPSFLYSLSFTQCVWNDKADWSFACRSWLINFPFNYNNVM